MTDDKTTDMMPKLKSILGDGKMALGIALLLIGVGVSMLGYQAESEKLINVGEMMMGVGVVHKLVKSNTGK